MSDNNVTNPFAKRMHDAEVRRRDAIDATTGERLIARDFATEAFKQAPAEIERIKALLKLQAEECNTQRPSGYPEFRYTPAGRIDAGKFAIMLQPDIRLNEYFLRVFIGLHPYAAQFVADIEEAPSVRTTKYLFQADVDDSGFAWMDQTSGQRHGNQAIIDAAMSALTDLIAEDRTRNARFGT